MEICGDSVPGEIYFVADTSVLVGALPLIRAVIESAQLPYVIYVPYVVLTELDRGRAAAPTNQLISRYMRRQDPTRPRLLAQAGLDHDKVFVAKGSEAKNDDLILGTALQLKAAGKSVTLLTNDHNLITKTCANGLQAMTSFDLLMSVPSVISAMNSFIVKDLRLLCPHQETILRFTMDLLASAVKAHLMTKKAASGGDREYSATGERLIYEILDRAIELKIIAGTNGSLLSKTKQLMREYRAKGRAVQLEDVRRLLKYVCAILNEVKTNEDFGDDVVAKTLSVCNGMYAAVSGPIRKSTDLHFDEEIKKTQKTRLRSGNIANKKLVVKDSKTARRKKPKTFRELMSTRREVPLGKLSETSLNPAGVESSHTKVSVMERTASVTVARKPIGSISVPGSSSRLSKLNEPELIESDPSQSLAKQDEQAEMEVDERSSASPGVNVQEHSNENVVHGMLEVAWCRLNEFTGSWAQHLGVPYNFPFDGGEKDFDHSKLRKLSDLVSRLCHFYDRLLKMQPTAPVPIQTELADRFLKALSEVWGAGSQTSQVIAEVKPESALRLFANDRMRDLMRGGMEQLNSFRKTMQACDLKLTSAKVKTERGGIKNTGETSTSL